MIQSKENPLLKVRKSGFQKQTYPTHLSFLFFLIIMIPSRSRTCIGLSKGLDTVVVLCYLGSTVPNTK